MIGYHKKQFSQSSEFNLAEKPLVINQPSPQPVAPRIWASAFLHPGPPPTPGSPQTPRQALTFLSNLIFTNTFSCSINFKSTHVHYKTHPHQLRNQTQNTSLSKFDLVIIYHYYNNDIEYVKTEKHV